MTSTGGQDTERLGPAVFLDDMRGNFKERDQDDKTQIGALSVALSVENIKGAVQMSSQSHACFESSFLASLPFVILSAIDGFLFPVRMGRGFCKMPSGRESDCLREKV